MNEQICKCLKCGTVLENIQEGRPYIQPLDGLAFMTYGHYGSTIFDPMDGTWLEIAVCDKCLLAYYMEVAPHLVEEYKLQLGHGDYEISHGLLGHQPINRGFVEVKDAEIYEDLVIIEDPFVASDPQPYHPELDGIEPAEWKWADTEEVEKIVAEEIRWEDATMSDVLDDRFILGDQK